jgi:hypothetical protein
MDPFENLSEDNRGQITKYIRFFGQKKDSLGRAIKNEFSNAQTDKLYEDMYSKDDVLDFCEYLSAAIKVGTQV